MDEIVEMGKTLLKNQKASIEKLIETIIDERF